MESGRFRELLVSDGPFASIYYDEPPGSRDGAEGLPEWQALRAQLENLGADKSLTDEIKQAVLNWRQPTGRRGRAVVAGASGVLLNEHLLRPVSTTMVRVSELPYIVPILEHGFDNPTYLLAMVDADGVDVAVRLDGTLRSEPVEGADEFVVGRIRTLLDHTAADAVFVAGDPVQRAHLLATLPERVRVKAVPLPISAPRGEYDLGELTWSIEAWFLNRQLSVIDDAAERFDAEAGRRSGRAAEGLDAVCSALRQRLVDTLIVGELGDATVVADQHLTTFAPDAMSLSEQGAAPARTLRADEALPLFGISAGASLVRTDERIAPTDGIAAVLRAPTRN